MTGREQKRQHDRARSHIIVKVVTSVVFGGVAFLVASAIDSGARAQVILSIGVSVFVSGIAFMTQFLVEADKSIINLSHEIVGLRAEYRNHAVATENLIEAELQKIDHEFTKVNAATKLFRLVESSDLETAAVTELVQHATSIGRDEPLIFDFAQSEIARLSANLRGLGQHADLTYDGEDRDWLLGLTNSARQSIAATSLTTVDAGGAGFVGGLWDHDLGRRYMEAQRAAVRGRRVRVRRILIIDRLEMHHDDAALAKVIEDQRRIGVDVRVLDPHRTDVPGTWLVDFIVVDGAAVYQSTATPRLDPTSNPVMETTRLITNPDYVRDRVERYEELWNASVEPPRLDRIVPVQRLGPEADTAVEIATAVEADKDGTDDYERQSSPRKV